MVVTKEQRSESVFLEGYYYATLDFTEPSCSSQGNQGQYLAVPQDWEIAPNSEHIALSIIARNPWGSASLIVADGCAIYTSLGSSPGVVQQGGALASEVGFKFKVQAVSKGRVLIRHPVVVLIDSQSALLSTWEQRMFTDCTVSCAGEETLCHRAILASRSPVFENMFTSGMLEGSDSRIDIGEAEPRHVRAMLKAIYIGQIDEDVDLAEVMMLADRYECHSLAKACAEGLVGTVDIDNICVGVQRLRSLRDKPPFDDIFEQMITKMTESSDLVRVMALK